MAVGALVLVGCVVALIIKLGGGADTPNNTTQTSAEPQITDAPVKEFEDDKPVNVVLTKKDIENYENIASTALTDARAALMDERYWTGVKSIRSAMKQLDGGGRVVPPELVKAMNELKEQEKELLGYVEETYTSLLPTVKEATSAEDLELALDNIARRCGPERREQASQEAPKFE